MQPCADCINDASGVEPKAAPGGQDGRICGMSDGEIGAGEPGGGEPSRRLSGGRCGRSRRQSCAARCRRRGRKCPHWYGHNCTARCGAKCGRAPQERPHECSERCAKRRREENAAVVPTMPSNAAPTVAVRHAAVSEASRRASGARSDRRERRREGYPPEGARPRSGLDRVARSRSDAPSLIVGSRESVSMDGTIDCITVCTIVVSTEGRVSVSIGVTASGTIIGNAVGARRTLSPGVARSCGGRAAGPPRSAAPQATRDAKAGRAAVSWCPTKKGDRAAGATRPVVAMQLRRPLAAPGFRAGGLCRRGSR